MIRFPFPVIDLIPEPCFKGYLPAPSEIVTYPGYVVGIGSEGYCLTPEFPESLKYFNI